MSVSNELISSSSEAAAAASALVMFIDIGDALASAFATLLLVHCPANLDFLSFPVFDPKKKSNYFAERF